MSYNLRSGKFSRHLSAYNLTSDNLGKWLSAYAKQRAGTRQAHVMFIGDSTTHGATGATPYSQYATTGLLKTYIDGLTGNSDVGWGYVPHFDSNNNSGDVRITYGSGQQANAPSVIYRNLGTNGSSTETVTLNVPNGTTIDTVDVYVASGFGATTTPVDVDGSPATAVNSATGTHGVSTGTYTVTAASSHTVTVKAGIGGNAWFLGFRARNSATNGVLVSKVGFSGGTVDVANSNPSGLPVRELLTYTVPADLYVIKSGINNTDGVVANFTNSIVGAVNTFSGPGSVVLVTPTPVGASADPIANNGYPKYVRALYEISDALSVPLIDLSHRWNLNYIANTSSFTTGVHPDLVGYRDEFAAVSHAIVDALVR